jgi:KRAB domain-containing zinc finger protein
MGKNRKADISFCRAANPLFVPSPSVLIFKCYRCPLLFATQRLVQEHSEQKHPKHIQCSKCDEKFHSQSELVAHTASRHPVIQLFPCDCCGKKFVSKAKRAMHIRNLKKSWKKASYDCTECDAKFNHNVSLIRHKMLHTNQFPFTCSICGKGCASKQAHLEHESTHAARTLKCDIAECNYFGKDKKAINRHKQAVHCIGPSDNVTCEICGKFFRLLKYLKQHLLTHKKDKISRPYKCEICGKDFRRLSNLQAHLAAHDKMKAKVFECDTCGKTISSRKSMILHQSVHLGIKQHVCEVCGANFVHRNTLVIHFRTHTGEKPYKCDICDKSFSQISALRIHSKGHKI